MVRWFVRYTLSILVVLFFTISTYKFLDYLPVPEAGNPSITPSGYPTRFVSPETPTLTASITFQPTITQSPSVTPGPQEWQATLEPVEVPRQTSTPRPEPYFVLQQGSPQSSVNFIEPEVGCGWVGIGGQVFDLNGVPLLNYLVHLEGFVDDRPVDILGLTGMAPKFGQGGYLIEIGSQPIESGGILYMQVLDMDARALSDKILVPAHFDCDKNLVHVNFIQQPMNLDNLLFLPSINKE